MALEKVLRALHPEPQAAGRERGREKLGLVWTFETWGHSHVKHHSLPLPSLFILCLKSILALNHICSLGLMLLMVLPCGCWCGRLRPPSTHLLFFGNDISVQKISGAQCLEMVHLLSQILSTPHSFSWACEDTRSFNSMVLFNTELLDGWKRSPELSLVVNANQLFIIYLLVYGWNAGPCAFQANARTLSRLQLDQILLRQP